jgi:hypothetical protein
MMEDISMGNLLLQNDTRTKKEKQQDFFNRLGELVSITEAASAAGISRQTVYKWLKDGDFRNIYDKTMEVAAYKLEEEALRRALDGVIKPIIYRGEQVGELKQVSDKLLVTVLKARLPARYGLHTNAIKYEPPEESIFEMTPEEIRQMNREILAEYGDEDDDT